MGKIPFSGPAERGRWGEQQAALYLRGRGYRLLAAGFKTRLGELDLVAEKDGVVAVVEVKTRSGYCFARGVEAVSPRKLARMKAAAAEFMAARNDPRPVRFDVAEILAGDCRDDPPRELNYYENVYTELA